MKILIFIILLISGSAYATEADVQSADEGVFNPAINTNVAITAGQLPGSVSGTYTEQSKETCPSKNTVQGELGDNTLPQGGGAGAAQGDSKSAP